MLRQLRDMGLLGTDQHATSSLFAFTSADRYDAQDGTDE